MHTPCSAPLPRKVSFLSVCLALTAALVTSLVVALGYGSATAAAVNPPIWVGDYNTGNLSQFQSTPWNNVPKAPTVVTSPVYEGKYAGRYVIPGGGSRSENVPQLDSLTEGEDLWFGFATRLGTDVPLNNSKWQVVAQWKNDGIGSAPFTLKIVKGKYVLDGGAGWPGDTSTPKARYFSWTIGLAKAKAWDRWMLHVVFSSTPSVATIDLYRNGTRLITGLHPPGGTLYPNLNSYVKVGYYRDSSISTQGTVYHDDWKVGDSKESLSAPVSPPAPTPTTSTPVTTTPAPTTPAPTTSAPVTTPPASSTPPTSSAAPTSTTPTSTTPAPPTTPAPSSTPAPPPPIWASNYNSGSFAQFDSTPWNNVPSAPSVVSSPVYDGGYAGRYVIPAGGSRCENVPTLRSMREGDDLWFAFSTRLDTGFPVSVSNWQILAQWKNDGTGSPPVELKVGSGQYWLDGGYGWPGNTSSPQPKYYSKSLGSAQVNVWVRWVFHIKFSSNATIGTVDIWRDGTQVASGVHMPGGTLYPALTSYLKVGYYRDTAIGTQGVVYHDGWKVGATRESVA